MGARSTREQIRIDQQRADARAQKKADRAAKRAEVAKPESSDAFDKPDKSEQKETT